MNEGQFKSINLNRGVRYFDQFYTLLASHTVAFSHYLFMVSLLFFSNSLLTAQQKIWLESDPIAIVQQLDKPDVSAREFRVFSLDTALLKMQLADLPHENDVHVKNIGINFEIPHPDSDMQRFKVVAYEMMEPGLAEKYSHIKTFYGIHESDPTMRIRMDWTEFGLHIMVRGRQGAYFIEPYNRDTKEQYIVYKKEQVDPGDYPFQCEFEVDKSGAVAPKTFGKITGDCQLRTYRLAQATTGEYSNFHGAFGPAQSGLVMSAVTTVINRVNEVYERDAAVRLIFVSNTDEIFFYNPSTDPYNNGNGGQMLGQNQTTCDNIIGSPNYDIGHVFSTGGGGVAFLFSVCNNSHKAKGVTGLSNPIGDPFSIDYVSHEIGHQYGGNHTQNNACNRNIPTAMEPGSASTIMGYAGICSPNVQPNSDDYFHGVSLVEMKGFLQSSGGNCATYPAYSNQQPTVDGGGSHFIPISTPFILSADGTDPNDDLLTYCWEQFDNQTGFPMPPQSTSTGGPLFRSLQPDTSPDRYMPNLGAVINGTTPTWEVIPSVGRSMNFKVTVRDNFPGAGCLAADDVVISTVSGTGPFLVEAPNNSNALIAGQFYLVQWDVANTDLPPVSCGQVDILLSTDGGFNYSFVLAENVPNNGLYYAQIPVVSSTQCRVMIKCSGNIFYDISNVNFPIQSGSADFSLGAQPASQTACSPGIAELEIQVAGLGGFNSPVNLTLFNPPAGVSAEFNPNPVSPGQSSTMTILGLGNLPFGPNSLTVRGQSGAINKNIPIYLNLEPGGVTTSLNDPFDQQVDVSPVPEFTFTVNNGLGQNEIQVALNPGFTNVVIDETIFDNFFQPDFALNSETTYYWRVRSTGSCGLGSWTDTWSFTTSPCESYVSTDVPVLIPSTSPVTVNSTIFVNSSGNIQDVNVTSIIGQHSRVGDLIFRLESPMGTKLTLMNQVCGNSSNFFLGFDDQALSGSIACPPVLGINYQPLQAIGAFNGENMFGVWTLEIEDVNAGNGGSLDGWGLDICAADLTFLSVDWLSYEVALSDNNQWVELHWSTTKSDEIVFFDIEKSIGTATHFEFVGRVSSPSGIDDNKAWYEFTDRDVPKNIPVYYRLKQTDISGMVSYSDIRMIKVDSGLPVSLFPNPVSDELNIALVEENETGAHIQLIDLMGRVLYKNSFEGLSHKMDMSHLPNGTYIIEITISGQTGYYRVIR